MRARRSACVLLAALTATTIGVGAAPAGAIVGGDTIASADLNPLIVVDGAPVAVDALVEVRS